MWRVIFIPISLLIFFFPALTTGQSPGFECTTCESDCAAQGLAPGERFCVVDDTLRPETEPRPNVAPGLETDVSETFLFALVHWEFVPLIEAIASEGAVSIIDVQRTVAADQAAIHDCFTPTSYPGDASLNVEVHLANNGVPVAITGSPQGLRPSQARCILRRAWRYEFPRLAEAADQPSRLHYRISFVPQRQGLPETDPQSPQLLLERVTSPQNDLQPQLAAGLYAQLPTVERCASIGLSELPMDLVVTEVDMKWRRSADDFVPHNVDITVTNHTGTQRPSQPMLDCFKQTLTTWDVTLDNAPEDLHELESTFFITTRPAGWYGR